MFASTLGYTRADADLFIDNLRVGVLSGTPTAWRLNPDQTARWSVVLQLAGPNGQVHAVMSGWRVMRIGNAPRLLTVYVMVGDTK